MMNRTLKLHHYLLIGGLILLLTGLVVGTALAQDDTEVDPVGDPPTFLTGYYEAWVNSPHAAFDTEAFTHWDEDEEQVVPARCAACHSTPGYLDYLGVDGSDFGSVESDSPLGTVVNCDACHNPVAANLTSVTFPSGVEATNIGDSTRCMVCHQGRASGLSVDEALTELDITDMNVVNEELGFINIHYYAAAASLYGSEVIGGYQYEGELYQRRFAHAEGYQECDDCHNAHSLELKVNECTDCHEDVETLEDVQEIRMAGSLIDYDGDGDIEEGIKAEIEALQGMLYEAIQAYASEVVENPIVYDSHAYPYFFVDLNANGEPDEDEANYGNRYNTFTGTLLKAVYNYQVSLKDTGGYAHNAKYHIELLYDSIGSLNEQISEPIDMTMLTRDDPGHFNTTSEAFRHWDEDGEVSASCSKCHTADGLPFFIEHGVNIAFEPSDEMSCTTCHNDLSEFTLYELEEVVFPSGFAVSFGEGAANNMCLNCHQGRESTVSVNAAINNAGVGDDEVSDGLGFRNPHYFAAGATLFGAQAQGAYQFDGKDYNGQFEHTRRFGECSDCHNVHSLTVEAALCTECHENVESQEDLAMIRFEAEDVDPVDYDGDGDVEEPIKAEIDALETALYDAIVAYTTDELENPIIFKEWYPYWFADNDADGDPFDEDDRYGTWTPNLLRAVYNYTYVAKDPGGYAHNPDYLLQVLYDSLEAIGGEEAVADFTRPPVIEMEED